MLDIKLIRDNPEIVREAMEKRGESTSLDQITSLDEQRRQLLHEMETLRAHRNEVSKQIGKMEDKPSQLIAEMRQLGNKLRWLILHLAYLFTDLIAVCPEGLHLVEKLTALLIQASYLVERSTLASLFHGFTDYFRIVTD